MDEILVMREEQMLEEIDTDLDGFSEPFDTDLDGDVGEWEF
jgi:hypothetical protein